VSLSCAYSQAEQALSFVYTTTSEATALLIRLFRLTEPTAANLPQPAKWPHDNGFIAHHNRYLIQAPPQDAVRRRAMRADLIGFSPTSADFTGSRWIGLIPEHL
jgi:hypothetical protein